MARSNQTILNRLESLQGHLDLVKAALPPEDDNVYQAAMMLDEAEKYLAHSERKRAEEALDEAERLLDRAEEKARKTADLPEPVGLNSTGGRTWAFGCEED